MVKMGRNILAPNQLPFNLYSRPKVFADVFFILLIVETMTKLLFSNSIPFIEWLSSHISFILKRKRTVKPEMVKLLLFVVILFWCCGLVRICSVNGCQRSSVRVVIHTNLLNYRIKNKCC